MRTEKQLDRIKRKRMLHAERKLKEAQRQRLRTERSILYWSRVLADLKHERTRAVQPPLWPQADSTQQ
jgi:hypothetical protein